MNFIKNIFSSGGSARIKSPVTSGQISENYANTQTGLKQQQDFLNQLAAQGGVQNQGNVFNQFQNIASGQAPSLAMAQLQNTTGQNVANQAALMAGQRGAGANAGLMARQAAMQGGALQQQAVGQGAALRAQEQQAALANMANIAGQQVQAQQGAISGYNQTAGNLYGSMIGAQNQHNQNLLQQQQMVNKTAGGLLNALGPALQMGATAAFGPVGGLAAGSLMSGGSGPMGGGAGQDMSTMFAAHGGEVPCYAEGGYVPAGYGVAPQKETSFLDAFEAKAQAFGNTIKQAVGAPGVQQMNIANQRFLKTYDRYGNPTNAPASNVGRSLRGFSTGGVVKGHADVKGDSFKNDTVPARLSPGEIVLPRSVTQHKNAPQEAKKFVEAIMMRKGVLK